MNIQHFERGMYYNDVEFPKLAHKLGKLATYCEKIKDPESLIRVETEYLPTKKQRDEYTVMINVTLPKKQFRVESRKSSGLEALDRCIEKLEPQIKKYKEMHTGKERARQSRSR